MNRKFVLPALLLFSAVFVLAQTESPKLDVFGGYSYLARSGVGSGWNAEANVNLTRHFGITADFSGNYSSTSVNITGVLPETFSVSSNINYHFFMVGPQFSFEKGPVRPFAHVLIGASFLHASATVSSPSGGGSGSGGTTAYANGLGIGLDVKLSRRASLRLVQADGLFTHFGKQWQAMARISSGVVFHF